MADWHGKRRHSDLALGQVVRHLADNHRRDHRLIALHVDDDGLIAKTAFLDHFSQALGPGLVIGPRHAHFPAGGFHSLRHVWVIGGNNHPLGP